MPAEPSLHLFHAEENVRADIRSEIQSSHSASVFLVRNAFLQISNRAVSHALQNRISACRIINRSSVFHFSRRNLSEVGDNAIRQIKCLENLPTASTKLMLLRPLRIYPERLVEINREQCSMIGIGKHGLRMAHQRDEFFRPRIQHIDQFPAVGTLPAIGVNTAIRMPIRWDNSFNWLKTPTARLGRSNE